MEHHESWLEKRGDKIGVTDPTPLEKIIKIMAKSLIVD